MNEPAAAPKRADGRLLALLILAAFALRLYRLDAQSLWYDEGVTVNVAQRSLADLTLWTANDIQPPLYYYIIAGWGRLAGWSEWSLRFPSAFFGILLAPLTAILGWRLAPYSKTAYFAALFAAAHPLLVYYSQEARMYTLLTALGVAAGYCLVKAMDAWRPWRQWLAFIGIATAALYTHYFAFFLLLALGCAVWLEQVFHPRFALKTTGTTLKPLRSYLLASLVALVLYTPWLGALWRRALVDASYWQGEFKLGEGVRNIALSFVAGETAPAIQPVWLLILVGLVTLAALLLLLGMRPREHAVRLFSYALPWLIVPVAGLLLLAFYAPKFNPRYVMLALPGLLLLWSGGLAAGWQRWWPTKQIDDKPQTRRWTGLRISPQFFISTLLTAFLLGVFMIANFHWFHDRAHTKDDWRQLTAFVRLQLEPQETVVLVSGHAWPVWHYYAPDIPVTRLPAIDVLDVNSVLTFGNTAGPLRTVFTESAGVTGAWLVGWQDEVVDPTAIVPVQLELGGREKGQSAAFWGLKLRRFSQIRPQRIVSAPPISHPLDESFGGHLRLHGYHVMENGDLLLFWQRQIETARLAPDYQITGETYSGTGALLARLPDQRPSAYEYAVTRWREDEVVMGRIPWQEWLGPAQVVGTYTVQLRVYTVQDGRVTPLSTTSGQPYVLLPIAIQEFD
jgi:4-amino-4-deoxy-L-arabinose transferase-like glycosyltransferase